MPIGLRPSNDADPSFPEISHTAEPLDKNCVCNDGGRGFDCTSMDKQTELHVVLEAIRELKSKVEEPSAASTIAASTNRPSEIPRIVVDTLTRTELRVIEYLWKHPNSVRIDSLQANCWPKKDVKVDAVKKAVRRAEQHLIEAEIFWISVQWSDAKDSVRLVVSGQPQAGQK